MFLSVYFVAGAVRLRVDALALWYIVVEHPFVAGVVRHNKHACDA